MLRGRTRRRSVLGGALAATLGLALGACSGSDAGSGGFQPRPVVVEVVKVEPEAVRDVVALVGQLDAAYSVKVRPDTAGVLESIGFREGEAVESGHVLFQLRSDEQRARLREAEAERELARVVYDRTKRLAGRDISSAAALDRARAELERQSARVDAARAELERTAIRAPFDGVMGALFVAPGARVEPENVLTQIDSIDRLQISFTLPEVAVGLAHPGIPFDFTVAPFPGESFHGELYFVAPTLDPDTRRLLVKGWVPNPEHRLRPGLFANIQAQVGVHEDALMVPEAALALDREGTFVWRLDAEDTAERIGVATGLRVQGRVEIVKGLHAGDRVVAAGTNKVRRGSRVEAAAPEASRLAGDGDQDETPRADAATKTGKVGEGS